MTEYPAAQHLTYLCWNHKPGWTRNSKFSTNKTFHIIKSQMSKLQSRTPVEQEPSTKQPHKHTVSTWGQCDRHGRTGCAEMERKEAFRSFKVFESSLKSESINSPNIEPVPVLYQVSPSAGPWVPLSAATTKPPGHLIYWTPLSRWISGCAVLCILLIIVKSSLLRGNTMSHPLCSVMRAGWVWCQGCSEDTKALSRHKKADIFQITAKSQRSRVCGRKRREGVLCFSASLVIIVRGMNCRLWRIYHTSHSHRRAMLQRQNIHYL